MRSGMGGTCCSLLTTALTFTHLGALDRFVPHNKRAVKTDAERASKIWMYNYNQNGEKISRHNRNRPYPPKVEVSRRIMDAAYSREHLREIGLGDFVWAGKLRWRKYHRLVEGTTPFVEELLSRGLKEIHHAEDHMDGRIDVCLGYAAIGLGEAFSATARVDDRLDKVSADLHHDISLVAAEDAPANCSIAAGSGWIINSPELSRT